MRDIEVHLTGAIVTAILIALAFRTQKSARLDANGWRVLRPNWFLNGLILVTFGVAALAGYAYLVGGSQLPNPSAQMTAALAVAIAFALGGFYMVWFGYGRTFRWRGDTLHVRTWTGREALYRISDIRSFTGHENGHEYRLRFADGSRLRMPAHMRGGHEFVSKLPKRVFTG